MSEVDQTIVNDWQQKVLQKKNFVASHEKSKTSLMSPTAEAGTLNDSEQYVAQQSASLSLVFGIIEYSPTPRNNFYFKKSLPGSPPLVTLNAREMLTMVKCLPEAMKIAHEIESRNEAIFEKKLISEFPDLDIKDGDNEVNDSNDVAEEEDESDSGQTQNRIFSKMIQEKGQNFVSLDVSKYNGRSYIWLKTYYLSKPNTDKVELVGTRQQFLFSAFDDLEGIVKFFRHCMVLNKCAQKKLREVVAANHSRFFRCLEKETESDDSSSNLKRSSLTASNEEQETEAKKSRVRANLFGA